MDARLTSRIGAQLDPRSRPGSDHRGAGYRHPPGLRPAFRSRTTMIDSGYDELDDELDDETSGEEEAVDEFVHEQLSYP